jgi:hypothetical protein
MGKSKSGHSRVTWTKSSLPDILKILQNLFDSVLTDVTKGMQEEDLVQVTLECPDLDFPIRLPFIQMNQLRFGVKSRHLLSLLLSNGVILIGVVDIHGSIL